MSISTIFLCLTVQPMTENSWPSGEHETTPAAPFTSAGRVRADRANCEKVSDCSATAVAPRNSLDKPARTTPPSDRSTTSGSSTATSASKSPPRAAARKASTTSRWRVRSASGEVAAPRTRRRARLASCLASGVNRNRTDELGDFHNGGSDYWSFARTTL